MAIRRMFSLAVVDTDSFLELPISAQGLYFHLGMRADDEGIVSAPKRIVRATGCSSGDLGLLITRGFVIPFRSGVCAIAHWKLSNYIPRDRYKPSVYTAEMAELSTDANGVYTFCLQSVYKETSQEREMEVSPVEVNKIENDVDACSSSIPYSAVIDLFNSICIHLPKIRQFSEKQEQAVREAFNRRGIEGLRQLFEIAASTPFLCGANDRRWVATFDWLVEEKHACRVLNGVYQEYGSRATAKPQRRSYGTAL